MSKLLSLFNSLMASRFPTSRSTGSRTAPVGSSEVAPRLPNADLTLAKQAMVRSLNDCEPNGRDRLLVKIQFAATAGSLWMLRSDVFQHISRTHGEFIARQRVDTWRDLFQPG